MMKYLYAIRYGNKETKVYLWSVMIGILATVIAAVLAISKRSWMAGIVALLFGIITFIIWQSKTLKDSDLKIQKESGEETEEKEPKQQKKISMDFSHYSEATLKKTMRKYRVRQEHRPVMIDSWASEGIVECPAYLWRDRRYGYLLLLTEVPLKKKIPLTKLQKMTYQPGVLVKEGEYQAMKPRSVVSSVFQAYVPDTYQTRHNDVISLRKNLYRLEEDILFTNTSAGNILHVLSPAFKIEDERVKDTRYNGYFVDAYQLNVLFRDSVLSVKEYNTKIRNLLRIMAQEDMVFDDFRKTLEQMVEYQFITDEFADYYINYRNQHREKKQAASQKKKRKKSSLTN